MSSNKPYQTSLHIFRRDLRVFDNNALNQACLLSERVIPCFIFDPKQIHPHPYQSKPGLQFLVQSVRDLQQQFQALGADLALYYDEPVQIIKKLHATEQISAAFMNRDYSPYSRQRDYAIAEVCKTLDIELHYLADALLTEPEQSVKADKTPYKVFTAFYQQARQFQIALPSAPSTPVFSKITGDFSPASLGISENPRVQPGGRTAALQLLDQLADYADYQQRDFPALNATSNLSAHLKFGTCSIREAFYAITALLGSEHPLLRQLYWRDFFSHLGYHFPKVFGQAFIEKYAALPFDNDPMKFAAWADGRTGFPIVDAGMRELNATGFMHNRVRMIVASFLVKDLHISWRWGERYFAQHLVDYDPAVNNGNWQWAASTGCDAQPYFRIFNPWLQQQKFDPDCHYIYRWLPELQNIPAKTLHQWHKAHTPCAYPAPMLDHGIASNIMKARFKALSESRAPGTPNISPVCR